MKIIGRWLSANCMQVSVFRRSKTWLTLGGAAFKERARNELWPLLMDDQTLPNNEWFR